MGSAADLARIAIKDWQDRSKTQKSTAGSTAWRAREPQLAEALLDALKTAEVKERAHQGELAALGRQVADLHRQLRDERFYADRMRLAYLASYDLAGKVVAECADPEHVDASVIKEMALLKPDDDDRNGARPR